MARRSAKHSVRRAEGFRVRRWLQLGAASAGMGAALLGLSTLGPDVGVAAADTPDKRSVSAGADDSKREARDAGPRRAAKDDDAAGKGSDARDRKDAGDTTAVKKSSRSDVLRTERANRRAALADAPAQPAETAASKPAAAPTDAPEVPWAVHTRTPADEPDQIAAAQIAAFTTSSQAFIESLPVGEPFKDLLEGGLFFVRRALFNQAPVVDPVAISSDSSGPIVGRVNAVDADGDRIVYRLVQGPTSGSVHVNPDGTYTYTPGADFNGVDNFVVAADDIGLNINLLNLSRTSATNADMLVNKGAIKFVFTYTDGATHWTPERRAALDSAANSLALYFVITKPVTLTYDVTGKYEEGDSDLLARAGSATYWGEEGGFSKPIIQNKLQSGADSNGTDADGTIDWNWAPSWALGDTVGSTQYDFESTAKHELLHSFGWNSEVDAAGGNAKADWAHFDTFIVNADGTRAVSSDLKWNTAFDPNLTGANGGLYFAGPRAVAVYGGLVPLYTPGEFEGGTSVWHLDDDTFTGTNQKMMNGRTGTGPGLRTLSPLEIAVLQDLGYTVVGN